MIVAAKRCITGDGRTLLSDQGVLVEKGLIKACAPLHELKKKYPREKVEDFGDATLMPAFIDTHTHIGIYDGCWDAAQYNGYRMGILAYQQAQEVFRYGVTTLRDAACKDGLLEALCTLRKYGMATLPRIFHCNQAIVITGGHCWKLSPSVEADGIDGLRTMIRRQIRAGADWIKIMTTHRDGQPNEFTQEELDFAVQETHRLGKKVFIHAALQPGLQMAINAGPDSIEHGTYLTVEQAEQMRDKGIYWVPTIASLEYLVPLLSSPTDSNPYFQTQIDDCAYYSRNAAHVARNFKMLLDTGVKVAVGTDFDTGYIPSAPVGKEIQYMIKYGMEPIKAIQAATNTAAELLGVDDTLGLLKEGYSADLTILKGDPLGDMALFECVLATYMEGECVYRQN